MKLNPIEGFKMKLTLNMLKRQSIEIDFVIYPLIAFDVYVYSMKNRGYLETTLMYSTLGSSVP